jgi:hypothetical protein
MGRTSFLATFFVLGAFLIGSPRASAQSCDIYVNASDGDDGNPGSLTLPLRSFELGYTAAPDGGSVCVSAGEYYLGGDSDGIALSIPGKSVTFRLNAFAGSSEVRFSEGSFLVDAGSGRLTFQAGTGSILVFGAGILNRDLPAVPELGNWLHTLSFTSGTIDLSGISARIEAPVGVPGRQHPTNPAKSAPDSARVAFVGATVIGSLTYSSGPRLVEIGNASYVLPSDLSDHTLLFSGGTAVVGPLVLPRGRLVFDGDAQVSLTGIVELDGSDAPILAQSSFTGSAGFLDEVTLTGAFPPAGAIVNRGPGSLSLAQVAFGAPSGAVLGTARVENTGGGQISLERTVAGTAWVPDITNLNGTLSLGFFNRILDLSGGISNTDRVVLAGQVNLNPDPSAPVALNNTGSLALGDHDLVVSGSGGSFLNSGVISGAGTLQLSVPVTLQGGGELPFVSAHADGIVLEASVVSGLSVSDGQTILRGSSITIAGALSIESSGSLTLEAGDIAIEGDVRFDGPLSSIGASSLTLVGDVSGSVAPAGIDHAVLGGSNQVVSTSFAWQDLTLAGDGSTITDRLDVSGQLRVERGVHLLPDEAAAGGFTQTGGEVAVPVLGTLSVAGAISLEGGSTALGDQSTLSSDSRLQLSGGVVVIGDGSTDATATILVGSDLIDSGGGFPSAGARVVFTQAGAHVASLASGPVLTSLSASAFPSQIRIANGLGVAETLVVPVALELVLEAPVSLGGDLTITGGLATASGSGAFVFGASSVIQADTDLPPIRIEGGSVSLAGSAVLAGDLTLTAGMLTVPGGGELSIDGEAMVAEAGTVDVGPLGLLVATGDLTVSGGVNLRDGGALGMGANADLALASLDTEDGVLRFSGAQSVISLPGAVTARSIEVSGSTTLTGGTVTLDSALAISGQLVFPASGIVLDPRTSAPTVQVNGGYTGTLTLLEGESSRLTLGGSGIYDGVSIRMNSDSRDIQFQGAQFTVAGTLELRVGGVDLQGARLSFQGERAGLALNVSDVAPVNAEPDGVRVTGGMVNPAGDPVDVSWTGGLTTLYVPGAELLSGPIRNLSIDVTDAVNSPPVFGIRLENPLAMTGALRVSPGALVRLENVDITASGPSDHLVDGDIAGTGYLRTVNALSLTGGEGGVIERLHVSSNTAGTTAFDVPEIGVLVIEGGVVRILERSEPVRVRESLSVSSGGLEIFGRLDLGPGASLTSVGSSIQIHEDHALYLGTNGEISVDEASSWTVVGESSGADSVDGGHLVLTGSTQLGIAPDLPRLRVAPLEESGADDVFLTRSLVVTESLYAVDGDFFLDQFDLTLDGVDLTWDSDGVPFDGSADTIFGDFAGLGGDVVLAGPGSILLGGNMELNSANLRMRAGADTDSVRVRAISVPREIILTNKQFSLERGVLDLGLNDIVLSGSSASVFRSSGGRLVGRAAPNLPPGSPGFVTDPELFPFDDDDYGELVLGAGSASIDLAASVRLDNLRLDGNLRLPNNGRTLTVGHRLAVGRDAARLTAAADGQIQLGSDGIYVQQGSGRLARVLEFQGAYSVFYDLHDGSVTGTASRYEGGLFVPGHELSDGFGEVKHFGVLAGPGAGVSYDAPLRVTGSLAVWAGLGDLGSEVRLGAGGSVYLASVDPASPPELSTGGGYAADGPISIGLSVPSGDLLISADLVPPEIVVSSLHILTNGPTAARVVLSGDRTVGELSVDLAGAGDRLNLNGSDLTASGSIALSGAGTTSSGPLAILRAGASFDIGPTATIEGAVAVHAEGTLNIQGAFSGLIIEAGSDLIVGGDLGPAVSVILSGLDQRLVLENGQETVRGLTLAQAQDGSVLLEGAELTVDGALRLESGVLDLGGHVLTIPSSPGGVTRPNGASSHVVGTMRVGVLAGASSTYTMHLGTASDYRPLELSFANLLSATTLEVGHFEGRPLSKSGLPVTRGGFTAVDTPPYFWTMSSTVNFAESQAYDLSLSVDLHGVGASQMGLILAQHDGLLEPWRAIGEPAVLNDSPRVVASALGVTGGLSPDGSIVTMGLGEARGTATGSMQAIHADATAVEGSSLFVQGLHATTLEWSEVTSRAPIEFGEFSSLAFSRGPADAFSAQPSLSPELATFGILAPGDRFIVDGQVPESPSSPGQVQPFLVHASPDAGAITVEIGGTNETLAPFEGRTIPSIPATETNIVVRSETHVALIGHRFDFAPLRGETIALVLAGYKNVPTGVDPSRGLQLWAIRADGSIETGVITTGAEEALDVPVGFSLLGNYPNPFNPTTTIAFDLPDPAAVRLEVFDLTGRKMASRSFGLHPAGSSQKITFDGSVLNSGVYLYRLLAGAHSASGRFVLMK